MPARSLSFRRLTIVTVCASALAALSLLAALWLVRGALQGNALNDSLTDNAHSAWLAADTVLSTLKDAETGQRGYLLTGETTYLAPYDAARARLEEDLGSLETAPFQDTDRTRATARLRELSAAKLSELSLTITLWQSGRHEAALDLVRTDQGRHIMDAVRAEVGALQADVEARLQASRTQAVSPLVWAETAGLAALGALLLGGVILLQVRANRVVTAGFAKLRRFTVALSEARMQQRRASTLLSTIVETAPGLIYAKNRDGTMLLANAATLSLLGKPWAEVEGRTDREFLADPAQGDAIMANDRRIMETGQQEAVEEMVGDEGSNRRVWLSTKTPLRETSGQVAGLVGVSVEITERKRVEDRLRQMINELNHRVKNTLATVQSIAFQTLRGADPLIRLKLESRFLALASAHEVLTRENWKGAQLTEIVSTNLASLVGVDSGRITVQGPPVDLKPSAALAIYLGVHELAINAVEYGALAVEGGTIAITWTILHGDVPQIRLRWQESGGNPVSPPATRGFGSRLIERSLAVDLGGTAQIRFATSGVVCEITAPLAEIVAPAEVKPFLQVGTI